DAGAAEKFSLDERGLQTLRTQARGERGARLAGTYDDGIESFRHANLHFQRALLRDTRRANPPWSALRCARGPGPARRRLPRARDRANRTGTASWYRA